MDVCPSNFWKERKRRTVKTIYTHAIDMARLESNEPVRETALKISLKFLDIT